MKNLVFLLLLALVTSTGLTMMYGSTARAQAVMDAGVPIDAMGSGSAVLFAPADVLHDPISNPAGAFDDVRAAKKVNWPLALLAGLLITFKGLATATKKWPNVRFLSWLNQGKSIFFIAGAITILSACFNTVALGGTWFAVLSAAAGAAFSLLVPTKAEAKSE